MILCMLSKNTKKSTVTRTRIIYESFSGENFLFDEQNLKNNIQNDRVCFDHSTVYLGQ